MKRPNGQVAGHRCDDRLPKADGNVEERRDATKAIIQKEYGPPDVLELGNIERPEIGDGEVLVQVRAAGVDREAAVLVISGLTALQALRNHGRVEPGQKALIIGASGGVGSFVVQIATAFGAEVAGVCSAAKVEMVRSIGADHISTTRARTSPREGGATT